MIVVLDIGDQHCDVTPPRSRKDDYWLSIREKLTEIRDLAHEYATAGFTTVAIFKGDLINRQQGHLVPYRMTNWLIDYFNSFMPAVQVLIIIGNHDVVSNWQAWERQPIGAIIKAGRVQNLLPGKVVSVTDGKLDLKITGQPHYYLLDVDREGYHPPPPGGDYHIHVVHGSLLPDGMSYFGEYTNVSQVDFKGNLILCGHFHEDLGVFTAPGKSFKVVNYGAIARGSVAAFNLNREVKIGVINLEKIGDEVVELINPYFLKCAKSVDKVFYVEEHVRKKLAKQEMEQLASSFQSEATLSFEAVSPQQLLEAWVNRSDISPEVRALVYQYVQRAEQELA
jgi:hypothetical protein